MLKTKGSHLEQLHAILHLAACNKYYFNQPNATPAFSRCLVAGCPGNCYGWLTTMEAHGLAVNHTARMRGLRLAGWVYECVPMPEKNNIFHFLHKNAQQAEMLEPRMVERLVGQVNPGIELYVREAA